MKNKMEPKKTGSTPIITGDNLRKMRNLAEKTTESIANYANAKTRKAYENWAQNRSFPDANQFATRTINCGFRPGLLMNKFYTRKNRGIQLWMSKPSVGKAADPAIKYPANNVVKSQKVQPGQ